MRSVDFRFSPMTGPSATWQRAPFDAVHPEQRQGASPACRLPTSTHG